MTRTLFKNRYPAKARNTDPVQSHAAADSMTPVKMRKQRRLVLLALQGLGPSTAKYLDRTMPSFNPKWDGYARRRMLELVKMGFVTRDESGPEMICSITETGRQVIKNRTKE